MLLKLTRDEIQELSSIKHPGITNRDRDEMAIPSYLHSNPVVRWLVWQRHYKIDRMARMEKTMSVLDFGCGIGVFLPTLCDQAQAVYACDLFPQYAKALCRERELKVTFTSGLNEIADASLDIIIAAEVLEHIDNLEFLVNQFLAKLKSDGRLLVSVPTEGLMYKIGRIVAGFGDKHAYHKLNAKTIYRIITGSGFSVEQTVSLPFFLPPHLYKIYSFRRS